jgi:excisionase family DNA binding protein
MTVTLDERRYYNITQAAELLGVSRVSIWRWIRSGRLPAARLGHRTTRIKREDLEQLFVTIAPGDAAAALLWSPAADDVPAPRADWTAAGAAEHFVQFYEADTSLVDAVAEYIGAALRAGDAGIVVATPEHGAQLEACWRAEGLDIAGARAAGRYVSLDAAEMLARFMVDDTPDPERFREVIGSVIAHAAQGRRQVRIFGEMVALLAGVGKYAATVRLETLWNELQLAQPFGLFCAYPLDCFGDEGHAELLGDVCATHARVIPSESYTALTTDDARLREITALQQKARALEAEIAERKRVEERLQVALAAEHAALQEAEAALRLRDEFLSIAAHELKTPLTGLSGRAQLILRQFKRGQLEPERVVQALETITGQTDKLRRLLNQLLDITRLEGGKLALERQPTDLALLVQQVAAGAGSGRHPINVTTPPTLTAHVDSLRLEQVLTNLLNNAIKYSPDGRPIDVEIGCTAEGALELVVRDRGRGIPPARRGQIFERFYQAHDDGHGGGLGLGLYISRQIVELHGGQIRAEFPADGGACFVVRLPLTDATPPALSDVAAGG